MTSVTEGGHSSGLHPAGYSYSPWVLPSIVRGGLIINSMPHPVLVGKTADAAPSQLRPGEDSGDSEQGRSVRPRRPTSINCVVHHEMLTFIVCDLVPLD